MFARRESLLATPTKPLFVQEVVKEHRLALQQVQTVTAEAPALRDNHPLATVLWNNDFCRNDVRSVNDARGLVGGKTRYLTKIGEHLTAGNRTWPRRENKPDYRV